MPVHGLHLVIPDLCRTWTLGSPGQPGALSRDNSHSTWGTILTLFSYNTVRGPVRAVERFVQSAGRPWEAEPSILPGEEEAAASQVLEAEEGIR